MTKAGKPLISGVFVMFPAMFIGTLFITYFTHGVSFSAAVMKASILGAINALMYGASTSIPMSRSDYFPVLLSHWRSPSIFLS